MQIHCCSYTDKEIMKMITLHDLDNDSKLNWNDFVSMFSMQSKVGDLATVKAKYNKWKYI